MPLRLRLMLVYAVAAAALVAGGALLFVHTLENGLTRSTDGALRGEADQLAAAVSESGANVDLGNRFTAPAEPLAEVVDPAGRVVARSQATDGTNLLDPGLTAAAQLGPSAASRRIGDDTVRVLAEPVHRADGIWLAVAGTSLEATQEALRRVTDELIIGGAVIVLLAGAGAWVLGGLALRPVERMRREVAEISGSEALVPTSRVRVPRTRDDLARLGATFNDVLDRLGRALDRQRQLVADAGHELRTPLSVLRTELELADRPNRTLGELREAVSHAATETQRLSRLADGLLLLAGGDRRLPIVELSVAPVAPIVDAAVRAADATARARSVRMQSRTDPDAVARIDDVRLRQAVDNLLDNALRVTGPDGTVRVSAARSEDAVSITVEDDGPGFPPEFLPFAFDRFRRADEARARADGGAGLGLAIVATIAAAHGGRATASNRPRGGAQVTIRLPAAGPG